MLRAKKRLRGKRDLWYFDKYILNYSDMTEEDGFHGEMCRFAEHPKHPKVLLLEPRGSLKSSCVTIGYALQQVVVNPNIRALIASEEFNTSKKFLSEIIGHIESNKEFIRLYGNLKGKGKWNEKEIVVATRTVRRKEPTITCAGIDVTKVGLHYDLIIVDDPHSSKNITTREQIEKVKTWYKLLLSLLDPGGKLIVIGTRWHYDDLTGYLIEQERLRQARGYKRRFRILQKSAVTGRLDRKTPDRDLLWPERLSREFLLDQLLDQGPYIFSCQYRNEPVDDESATFKRSWIKFYDPKEVTGDDQNFYATVDPARDEEGKDFTVICTVSVDTHHHCYVREIRRGKWDEHEIVEQLFHCYRRWNHRKIGIETVAWQKLLYRYVRQESRRRGYRLPICELKTDSRVTKRMRIRSMVPYWKSGLFSLPGFSIALLKGNMATLVDELLRFPLLTNDDCVDALAYVDQLIRRPLPSKILRKKAGPGSFEAVRKKSRRPSSNRLGVYNVR